jgi:hypothetical protein
LELARAANTVGKAVMASKREPRYRYALTIGISLLAIAVASLTGLYVARPSVEPIDVFVRCPICDRGGPFLAPPDIKTANAGAVFSVRLQNTGKMSTTLLNHNLSFRTMLPGESLAQLRSLENPCPDDDLSIPIGAQSTVTLAMPAGDVLVAAMRKIVPSPDESDYLFGHYTYRTAFNFSTTKHFCFHYIPPSKGVQESWTVCRNEP